jgi:hypothetical protein
LLVNAIAVVSEEICKQHCPSEVERFAAASEEVTAGKGTRQPLQIVELFGNAAVDLDIEPGTELTAGPEPQMDGNESGIDKEKKPE